MHYKLKNALIILALVMTLFLMVFSFIGRDSVSFIENTIGNIVMPIGRFFSGVGNYINEKTEPLFNVLNYKTLNENLMSENVALKEQILKLKLDRKEIAELKDLKEALNFNPLKKSREFITANVIAKDPGNWFNFFTIDVGESSGVTKNSAVLTGKGLVGVVYETGKNWSKVITVIDQRSSVSFELATIDGDFDGIINGSKNFELIGEFFDDNAEFKVGDKLITSGIGIYPKGILIGEIDEIYDNQNDMLRKIKVSPAVNFRQINMVIIVPYKELE